ncbi:methyltransferase family protein [Ruminiclostridium sufflavum DSM 19573]|uniref:Methyltransferase family protein n=1 Tax=Ruminiclostridium sufflavum DSM 19573 TaxID=1121337 RepID=A0A318XQ65_9FIRM|nr:class I SAM-dependent methyltransferase [Ruminiclostridium sufflavum]PYG90215.1 methyltransferase family protein [Ruminiclostridium sufflavum DSM 19573]
MNKKAYEFDAIANGPFFPVYPVIAQQIKDKTKILSGRCLDIGSGGGHLGLSLAQITNLEVVLLDKLEDAIDIADRRVNSWGLSERASTLLGDAQQIPLQDNTVNLCISRGSVWFWEDQKKGFEEIYRVLANGGMAYIGGGFGNEELKKQVDKKMKGHSSEWPKSRNQPVEGNAIQHFIEVLYKAGIFNFEITDDERGIWVIFEKPEIQEEVKAC